MPTTAQRNFSAVITRIGSITNHASRRSFISRSLLGLITLVSWVASAETAGVTNKPTLYYIPHTHWEGAVFKTREEYLEVGLPHILKALQLLKQYPDYKFTLDQVAYFRPFLERYPEEAAAFRQFVAQGRLEIVGGMDVMPDVVKPGGELFVRQMQYGQRYCREQFGHEVTAAWLVDTFGHHPQMPQLLRLAGYESFWFSRGVPHENLPSEFRWRGIDGTEIPAFWLPGFYGLFYGPPRDLPGFAKFFQDRFNDLNPHASGPERVGLAGVDVSEPEEYVPPLIAAFNQRTDRPFTIRTAVPSEFAKTVAQRKSQMVLTNDFDPIFQGTYSSRIELKQSTRRIEEMLLTAEKLSALRQWLGEPQDDALLWRAWEPVLFNQTHDLASGVMTDHVYEDTVRSYDFSQRLAGQLIDSGWESLTARIDTRGDGIPIVVFNPLGWSRTDVAEIEVGFTDPGIQDLSVLGASGKPVPFQVLHADRDSSGRMTQARVLFVAQNVPALGYELYRVVPQRSANAEQKQTGGQGAESFIENEFYRIQFDPATGAMTSLLDRAQQWEALGGPANVVACQADKGDLWELYRGLDGASHIAMTNRQAVPRTGVARLTSETSGPAGVVRRGPVLSEFSISRPFAGGSFATRVRLYAGVRRVDIRTELVNKEKYVRYQALFPTSISNGRNVQEIPFGALERPVGIEFPAQQWADYSDDRHGLALLNIGLPGNLASEGTLMLSLMRSHNLGAYGFGGGYEPGMSSETAFQIGKQLAFDYALVPHEGNWRKSEVYRSGLEFNHPLIARKVVAHGGPLQDRWSFMEISPSNVVMTSLKPGPGKTLVLRVYEASGRATSGAKIRLPAKIIAANEANLLEDSGPKLKSHSDTVQFDLHPFEIKTIKLQVDSKKLK